MRESSLYSHTSTNTIAECVRERENSAFEVYGRRNDTSTRLLFFSLLLPRCGHDTCCAFFLNSFITLFRAGALVWEFRFPGAVQKWPVLKCSSHIRLPFWAVTPSYRLAKLSGVTGDHHWRIFFRGRYQKMPRRVFSVLVLFSKDRCEWLPKFFFVLLDSRNHTNLQLYQCGDVQGGCVS